MYKKNKNNVAKLLLAFGVLASPMMLANQVSADNSISNTTNFNNVDATATAQSDAVTTDNVINENKEEKEQAKEVVTTAGENTATDVTEATETTSQTDEKSNEKSDVVENKKEVDYKLDASQRHELKEAGYTDEEIQEIENSINESLAKNPNFNVYEFVVSKLEAKKPENKDKEENKEKSELEISEKQDREAVGDKTPEADAKNISNEITNVNGAIEGLINKNATTIKPIANDPNLEGKDYDTQAEGYINFDVPNTTKKGDYVDIQMTNITTVNGIVEDFNPGALDAFIGPEKIATASYDKDERILRYTFTDDVEKYGKVNISARFPLFIDKNKVTEPTSTQVVGIKVGDKAIEKTYTVDYHMDNIGQSDKFVSNGYSDISHVNLGSKSYDHIIYMNPLTKEQKGTIVQIENLPGQDGVVNDGVVFDKDVLDSVEVYAVEDVSKLPMSFAWNEETEKNLIKLPKTEPDTNKTVYTKEIVDGKIIVKINNKQDPAASLNNRGPVNNKAAIVIRYKGKLKDDAKKDTATRVTFNNSTQSKQDYFFWDNIIYTTDAAASGTGQEEVGYFQDYHVYQTIDKDGKITTDEIVFKDQQSGNKNQTYTTIRKDREGYEFISVESPDGAAFGEKGAEATGNFVNGKTLHVKYVYQKREKPAAKTGKFKETHVYKTLDFDGNVVEDKTITEAGKSSEGKKDEKYESSKVDKDGYELVKVTADKGSEKEVTISEDGKSVEPGNYVEDKELSVTYEYVRRPGRFVEKHIYQTVDKDGKVIKTDYTVVVPEEGKPAVEGFSNEQIKTGQKPRDGYTFKSETELESANYIPGKTLEKTYIYTKTQEEPAAKTGKFKETHVYKTLDFDGNVVEDKTITEAGKSSEGKKDEKYESSKVDKDGYELVKVTADKGSEKEVTISEDGKSVEPGNYVEDKELSVTYEYVRRPGRFVEKHIYQTVDKDGKVIKTDYTVVVPEEGKPAVEGFSNEQIKTGQKPRDGYTFKSETELESANYIPGKTLEKTYIYTKTQ
ncbi:hypothetical protein B9N58_04590, partial [Finegoldia magna]|uniref:Ig-like domain-containing protein n=1 Tax=Finegoldia magna TaxID=1260 RepID=UPI000B9F7497